MHSETPKPLLDRLLESARMWASANERTLGALASIVVNHGSFFDRIEGAKASATTATLEKFARFLGDAANWPEGAVPEEVRLFVHVTGVSTIPDETSPGKRAADFPAASAA